MGIPSNGSIPCQGKSTHAASSAFPFWSGVATCSLWRTRNFPFPKAKRTNWTPSSKRCRSSPSSRRSTMPSAHNPGPLSWALSPSDSSAPLAVAGAEKRNFSCAHFSLQPLAFPVASDTHPALSDLARPSCMAEAAPPAPPVEFPILPLEFLIFNSKFYFSP